MTMLAAITLLPALLGFVGRNIDKLGLPHRKERPGDASGPSGTAGAASSRRTRGRR